MNRDAKEGPEFRELPICNKYNLQEIPRGRATRNQSQSRSTLRKVTKSLSLEPINPKVATLEIPTQAP